MRIPALVLTLAIVALWIGCILAYPELPERIPQQFGLDGDVNRWATKSLTSWFLLPIIATAIAALMFFFAKLATRRPDLMNYPGKEDVLKLTGEPREAAIAELQAFLLWLGVAVVLVFGAAAYSIARVAAGESASALILLSVGVLGIGTPILLGVMSARISGIVDAERARRR